MCCRHVPSMTECRTWPKWHGAMWRKKTKHKKNSEFLASWGKGWGSSVWKGQRGIIHTIWLISLQFWFKQLCPACVVIQQTHDLRNFNVPRFTQHSPCVKCFHNTEQLLVFLDMTCNAVGKKKQPCSISQYTLPQFTCSFPASNNNALRVNNKNTCNSNSTTCKCNNTYF